MKFSTAALPLLALVAQQVQAIALPWDTSAVAEAVEARWGHNHHHLGGIGRAGGVRDLFSRIFRDHNVNHMLIFPS